MKRDPFTMQGRQERLRQVPEFFLILFHGQSSCLGRQPHSNNTRNIFCPRTQTTFLAAAKEERGEETPVFSIEEPNAFGAMKFMGGDGEKIKTYMDELKEKRVTKQPLEYPSAGSTFKRPEGYFAGKLIMDAGLRGYQVGDAQVSEKHCGFVINKGNATAADVLTLIENVREKVQEQFGVTLEPEVKFLGEF